MKTNWILFAVGLLLWIPCYFTLQSEEMNYRARDSIPFLFPGFVPDNVRLIQLQKRKSEEEIQAQNLQGTEQFEMLAFERGADGWLLANTEYQGLPVRSGTIDRNSAGAENGGVGCVQSLWVPSGGVRGACR